MESPQSLSPADSVQLARELLNGLRLEEKRRQNRPLLKAWSIKIPIGLHRELKALSKASGHSMTSILVTTATLVLPTLRAAFSGQQAMQQTPALPTPQPPAAPPQAARGGFFSSTSSTSAMGGRPTW